MPSHQPAGQPYSCSCTAHIFSRVRAVVALGWMACSSQACATSCSASFGCAVGHRDSALRPRGQADGRAGGQGCCRGALQSRTAAAGMRRDSRSPHLSGAAAGEGGGPAGRRQLSLEHVVQSVHRGRGLALAGRQPTGQLFNAGVPQPHAEPQAAQPRWARGHREGVVAASLRGGREGGAAGGGRAVPAGRGGAAVGEAMQAVDQLGWDIWRLVEAGAPAGGPSWAAQGLSPRACRTSAAPRRTSSLL